MQGLHNLPFTGVTKIKQHLDSESHHDNVREFEIKNKDLNNFLELPPVLINIIDEYTIDNTRYERMLIYKTDYRFLDYVYIQEERFMMVKCMVCDELFSLELTNHHFCSKNHRDNVNNDLKTNNCAPKKYIKLFNYTKVG